MLTDFWEQSSAGRRLPKLSAAKKPLQCHYICSAGEKLSKALLEADEGEHSESEASEDDEAVPADVLFAMVVNTKVVRMDSLQKSSALLIGKMKPEFQIYNGKPLPKILLSLVNDLTNKDLCK